MFCEPDTLSDISLADRAKFDMITGTNFEVPVNLTKRHICRLIPQVISWVGVCAAKDSVAKSGGHDAVAGTVFRGTVG